MENKEIKCRSCGKWEPYPIEWKEFNQADQDYLTDGYICEICWQKESEDSYFRNGIAELII